VTEMNHLELSTFNSVFYSRVQHELAEEAAGLYFGGRSSTFKDDRDLDYVML